MLLGQPVLEPAAEIFKGGRGDVENFDVLRELDLVALADEQQAGLVYLEGGVYPLGDVLIPAAVALAEPLVQPPSHPSAG